MRIKLSQLRQIIKEEVARSIAESGGYNDIPDEYGSGGAVAANRGAKVSDAEKAILALRDGTISLDQIPQELTSDDLLTALAVALRLRNVTPQEEQTIKVLLQNYC